MQKGAKIMQKGSVISNICVLQAGEKIKKTFFFGGGWDGKMVFGPGFKALGHNEIGTNNALYSRKTLDIS